MNNMSHRFEASSATQRGVDRKTVWGLTLIGWLAVAVVLYTNFYGR